MCGSKGEEDDALDGHSGELAPEGKCARPAKTILFILNIIIWIGSCAILGLGIYAVVDNSTSAGVMDGNLAFMAGSVLIIVGSVGFIISFLGCCGAFTSNKCLIMTYVVVLGILLGILLIGAILAFFFSSRLQSSYREAMLKSLIAYDKDKPDSPIVKTWDSIQRSIKCCGVVSSKDWGEYNEDFQSGRFPKSCCTSDQDSETVSATSICNDKGSRRYSKGCHAKIVERLVDGTPVAAIVTAVLAFFMILGMILGIVAYTRL